VAAAVVLIAAAGVVARLPVTWRPRLSTGTTAVAPLAAATAAPQPSPPAPQPATAARQAAPAAQAPQPAPAASVAASRTIVERPLPSLDAAAAYAAIAARWGRAYERRPGEEPCQAIRRSGLDCIARRGTWNVVRRFDLPAVLELASATGAPRFLAVVSADDRQATVRQALRDETVSLAAIEREWDGGFVLLWKPPRPGMETIGVGAKGPDVGWLRQRLGALDGQPVPSPPSAQVYDQSLASRVTAFQRAHGLRADGIAGEETLAMLTALVDPGRPSLRRSRGGP